MSAGTTSLGSPQLSSLLVDAGDGDGVPGPPLIAAHAPNASRPPEEWVAQYVRRMLAQDPEPQIDYAFNTHSHGDHMAGPD